MPNSIVKGGLRVVGPALRLTRYYKSAAVALGVGDPVIRAADSADAQGYGSVTRYTAGAAITGAVVSVEADLTNRPTRKYLASGDTGYVIVADHPDQEFIIEDNGSATIAITNLGEHINFVAALDCDTTTGKSNVQLNASAISAGNTMSLRRKVDTPDNAVGVNCKWVVVPNLHTECNASATNVTSI